MEAHAAKRKNELGQLSLVRKPTSANIAGPPALQRQVALCELLDRVLNKGAVLVAEMTISVADIDLLYLGINLVVSSWQTILEKSDETCSSGVGLPGSLCQSRRARSRAQQG